MNCEAIERNQEAEKVEKKEKKQQGKKVVKFAKQTMASQKDEANPYYCTVHGKNKTHNSANCYSLKNAPTTPVKPAKRTFTNKGLCQEINLLASSSSKEKVLDLYMNVITKEKAKLKKKKKAKKEVVNNSDSDSDTSMAMLEQSPVSKKRKTSKDNEKSEEEMAFLKTINAEEDSEETSDDN